MLVTGAGGFVGRSLVPLLRAAGHEVIATKRRGAAEPRPGEDKRRGAAEPRPGDNTDKRRGAAEPRPGDDPNTGVRWVAAELSAPEPIDPQAFDGVEVVIHLAGLAHVPPSRDSDLAARVRRVNVDGSLAVARTAAAQGVRRFVFLSSVLVYGDRSEAAPLTESNPPAPTTLYGHSKVEAEQDLKALAEDHRLELVVVRAPLVYGPGVGGNVAKLLRWAAAGRPLPSATLDNRRSFIALGNLCDALATAAMHPDAANRTYVVSDNADVSTGELFGHIVAAFGGRARFVRVPLPLLTLALRAVGKGDMSARLFGDLRVDPSRVMAELSWRPRVTMAEECKRTVEAFYAARHSSW